MKLPYSRVLVTGATGFIGANLCRMLAESDIETHAIDLENKLPAARGSHAHIAFHYGDITNASFVTTTINRTRPEAIFHLAAYGTFGHEQDVQHMIDVNIGGTRNILAAGHHAGCKTVVLAGSIKEYAPSRSPITEAQRLRPWDAYAATKAAASFFARLDAAEHALPVTVLRLSPVYGPRDTLSRFVPTAIRAALEGTPFTISVGSLVRNFTYIDDVVAAFLNAALRQSGRYEECNVAAAQASSFDDILDAVEVATGKKISRVVATTGKSTDGSWIVDNTVACRLLGWQPRVTLAEGITRCTRWYSKEYSR